MRRFGITAVFPGKNLSKACKYHKKYPYLLRNKVIRYPNQVWSTDITYIKLPTGNVYLMAIIDWFSRSITNEYGNYALVMKKSWAKSKGLNPVLYFEEHSLLTGILGELEYLSHAVESAAEITDAEDSVICRAKSLEKSMYGLFGYIKSYQNKVKTGKIPENYIFYDEKEWRYVPHHSELKQEDKLELLISKERYEQNKEYFNSKAREYKLSFEIEDMEHVVLSHKKEIKELKKKLLGNTNISYEQLKGKIKIFDKIKRRRILYNFMKL